MARAAVGRRYRSDMPLRYVDPHKRRGPGYWAAGSFGRSPAGQWFARQVGIVASSG
jgi:hypothetical protein